MITELTPLEQAAKAYPDLWHRYICLTYGVETMPKNIVLTEKQAGYFIWLTKVEEYDNEN
jgi:DNA-binding transcriptional MocR family regulator